MPEVKHQRFRGVPLARVYGGGQRPSGNHGWWLQVVGTLLFLMLAVSLFLVDGPWAAGLQKQVAFYLTSSQTDWTPRLNDSIQSVLWLDSFDRHSLAVFGPDAAGPDKQSTGAVRLPVSGRLVREFGWAPTASGERSINPGVDIQAGPGDAVVAVQTGTAMSVEGHSPDMTVRLDHGSGISTTYQGLDRVIIRPGENATSGSVIGYLPNEEKPILHFEVREKGAAVDPLSWLKQ